MAIFNVGGSWWSPDLVGWGMVGGGGSKCEMKGRYSGRLDGGSSGRLTDAKREKQTLEVWDIPAVYALYHEGRLIYVGQAKALGNRLLAHYKHDHLVGRWDAFSWVSPVRPVQTDETLAWPETLDTSSVTRPSVDDYLKQVEAFAVLIGEPVENRQKPDFGGHFYWLEQVKSIHSELSDKEKLDFVYRQLAKSSEEGAG